MLTYKIKYIDLMDNEVEETVRFHFTQDEMLSFIRERRSVMAGELAKIQDDSDYLSGYAFVRDLVVRAYGERSEDGKRFIKNDEVRSNLTDSPLIDAVMETLFETEKTTQAFIDGVMPPKMRDLMNTEVAKEEAKKA